MVFPPSSTDVTEVEYRQLRLETRRAGRRVDRGHRPESEASLAELARLAETAGSEVLEGLVQRRTKPDPATYIGSGKVRELRDVVGSTGADTVICDGELSPGQLRQLEEQAQGQGHRPDRADPRHLRPARPVQGGQGAGRAGAAAVPAPAAARLGSVAVPAGRWPRGRRATAAWVCAVPVRPSSRPTGGASASADLQAAQGDRRAWAAVRDTKRGASAGQRGAQRGDRRLHQRGQVQPAQRAHRGRGAGRGRAVRHPRPDHPARRRPRTGRSTR